MPSPDEIRERYAAACNTHRYGSTPAIRDAARLTAEQIRDAHPDEIRPTVERSA